ncbi:MAG: AAA family ATPase [Rivularia sp. ALOHA_DT_140]|nr:AAA family ATPase [Rivularia sp. ALOHA_DT_140]
MFSKIIIINGPPGVGKSTIAELLAQSSQNSVCIRGDDIKHWIVNRNSEDLTKGLTYINGGACCRNYLKAGYELIVFEYVFTKKFDVERFTENCGMKESYFLFTLIAPLPVIKQREFSRLHQNRKALGKAVDIAYDEIIKNKADLGTFINTEFLSPQQTCELIHMRCFPKV